VLQSAGIFVFGPLLGDFRAAQLAVIVIAACLPAATFFAARTIGVSVSGALVAGAIVGFGGVFAPAWVSVDGFAPAAILGTLFFILIARAADGSVLAGGFAGLAVGLLYLARAEGALFGLPLVALALLPRSRGAGVVGALVALAIGGAWLDRDLSLGPAPGLISRTALLVRYEDFFAVRGATDTIFTAPAQEVIGQRVGALASNAALFLISFGLVLAVPLVIGLRTLWAQMPVRAWTWLALLIFAAQSLVWTLHSTRGSYFHSLAAFFPFGVAIAVAGGQRLLARREPTAVRGWTVGAVGVIAVLSVFALVQWDAVFNAGARTRAAALDAIPSGAFLAIDGAAWRWLSGRSAVVTPSDGPNMAACVASTVNARSLVLEEAHFSAYDDLYRGGPRPAWLGAAIERGSVKVFPITGELDLRCGVSPRCAARRSRRSSSRSSRRRSRCFRRRRTPTCSGTWRAASSRGHTGPSSTPTSGRSPARARRTTPVHGWATSSWPARTCSGAGSASTSCVPSWSVSRRSSPHA
jgi:hypothetical protein